MTIERFGSDNPWEGAVGYIDAAAAIDLEVVRIVGGIGGLEAAPDIV